MEFRNFKHKMYSIRTGKWTTVRTFYVQFNTGRASNVIGLQPPASDYEDTWTLIPTLTYRHDISVVPGPSFTLKLKWLKWDILTLKWSRSWKGREIAPEESVTARIRTYLDEDIQIPASRFPSQIG